MRERKSIFRFPFSARVISFSFIDLNEDVWTVCMCVRFTPDGGCCLPPLVSIHPMIPSRLSGRAADRLSDEMMTLLWEVIPKWKVSGKDCTPSHTATPFLPCLAASCVDHDWFASDSSQEAPIDFPVFYQKYLFTVVSLGHFRDLYCQFPNGTWWKRDDSPHPMTR